MRIVLSRLVLATFICMMSFWLYEIQDILKGVIYHGRHMNIELVIYIVFFFVCLVAMWIVYPFAFREKEQMSSERKAEIELIESGLALIEDLYQRLGMIFNESQIEKTIQHMRDNRKRILTGQGRICFVSVGDFTKGMLDCSISFDGAEKMMDEIEAGIKLANSISQKQKTVFLQRIINYRQKFSDIRDVFEKFKTKTI